MGFTLVQELEKEILVYDLGIDKAFCLNKTSAIIWQLCNGANSVADIAELMSRKLKILEKVKSKYYKSSKLKFRIPCFSAFSVSSCVSTSSRKLVLLET